MVKRIEPRWVLGLAVSVLIGSGCQFNKSANPLSPSVAGPIAGVNISPPALLEPGQDSQILMRDQPVKLMFQNAGTSGQRPLFYTLEIATDSEFKSIIFTRTRIEAGTSGSNGDSTTFQLPDVLPTGRTYWWRVRAEDGANVGAYSKAVSFVAVATVTLGAPTAALPNGTTNLTPEFRIRAGSKTGPFERISYRVEVANNQAFSSIAATFVVDETGSETIIPGGYSFLGNRTYYWRVQARDSGESRAVSPFSNVQTFRTDEPLPPPPPPGPPGPPDDGPPPGPPGPWQNCGSTPGDGIVQCVRNAVYKRSTLDNAFDITKRVAWLLRGRGYGLLLKPGGENIITWRGRTVSISRIMLPTGKIIKVLSDAGPGGSNGASWQECDDRNDLECYVERDRYVPAMQPEW